MTAAKTPLTELLEAADLEEVAAAADELVLEPPPAAGAPETDPPVVGVPPLLIPSGASYGYTLV